MPSLPDRVRLCVCWLDDSRHAKQTLIAVVAVAFAFRLAAALAISLDYKFGGDTLEYMAIARNVLDHGVYGRHAATPYALIPPGYPLFVAGLLALSGRSLLAVRLGQMLLATLMVWQTYAIGRRAWNLPVGLLAAAMIALYPPWIVWPVRFLTEPLYTVLLLAFVACLVRAMQRCTVKWAVATGAAFGLALLTRETLYVFPLLFPLLLWWCRIPWQRGVRFLALFVVAVIVTVSPWLLRNYLTFGRVFYTDRTDATLWRLTGFGHVARSCEQIAGTKGAGRSMRSPEYLERFGHFLDYASLRALRADPATYMRRTANRFVEIWLHPNGLVSLPRNKAVRGLYVAAHWVMLALAAAGMVMGLCSRDPATGIICLMLVYNTAISLLLLWPVPRYTLPFLPLVFLMVGMLLHRLSRAPRPTATDSSA